MAFGVDIDCVADPDTDFRRYGRMVKSIEPFHRQSEYNFSVKGVSTELQKWFTGHDSGIVSTIHVPVQYEICPTRR